MRYGYLKISSWLVLSFFELPLGNIFEMLPKVYPLVLTGGGRIGMGTSPSESDIESFETDRLLISNDIAIYFPK